MNDAPEVVEKSAAQQAIDDRIREFMAEERARQAEERRRKADERAIRELEEEFPDPVYTSEQLAEQAHLRMLHRTMKTVSVQISLWNYTELDKRAHIKGRKLSDLLRNAVRQYLNTEGNFFAD